MKTKTLDITEGSVQSLVNRFYDFLQEAVTEEQVTEITVDTDGTGGPIKTDVKLASKFHLFVDELGIAEVGFNKVFKAPKSFTASEALCAFQGWLMEEGKEFKVSTEVDRIQSSGYISEFVELYELDLPRDGFEELIKEKKS